MEQLDETYYKKLGEKLSKIRESKGLTQRKVAEAMGVTFQQYQKYESGSNRIPTKSLVIFCNLTKSDMRELTGVSIKDYDKEYKKTEIYHNYNTTYINNFNGLFSNLFNIDLRIMKNKIAVASIIIGVLFFFFIECLKLFASIYNIHYANLLSLQFLAFMIVLTIVMFVVFSYSWLTYIIALITYTGIYGNLHRFIFLPQAKFNHPVLDRFFMYFIAAILVFITFYILKKYKVNLIKQENDEHNIRSTTYKKSNNLD